MPVIKANLPNEGSAKSLTNLVGAKTISSVSAYKFGVVSALELLFTDASVVFIKFASNGGLEIGGTCEMGTGTKVGW